MQENNGMGSSPGYLSSLTFQNSDGFAARLSKGEDAQGTGGDYLPSPFNPALDQAFASVHTCPGPLAPEILS